MKETDPLLPIIERSANYSWDERSKSDIQGQRKDDLIKEELAKNVKLTDGKYSWFVLLMMVFSNLLTRGFIRSFGILVNAIEDYYPDVSNTLTGILVGLLSGFCYILGPISSGLLNVVGFRSSICLGGFLIFIGLTSSIALQQATFLPLTLASITGAGFCFVETVNTVIIPEYFKDKLSFANGIRVGGKSLGGMVGPFFIAFLLEDYGLKLTYLMIAATLLHIFLVAVVIQPFHIHKRLYLMKLIRKLPESAVSDKRHLLVSLENKFRSPNEQPKKQFLDWRILKDPKYLLFVLVAIFVSFAIPIATIYIPIYGKSIGLSAWENSIVLLGMSVMDLFIRIVIGLIINIEKVKKTAVIAICLLIGGIATCLVPLTSNMLELLASSCFFSLGYASYIEFVNVILCDIFGKEILSTALGFGLLSIGITNAVISYIIGLMQDFSGNLVSTFILMGVGLIIGSILLFWEAAFQTYDKKYCS